MTAFEDQYLDVLHNIESGIMMVYRTEPDLVDFDVENAVNALVRLYTAEMQGRTASPTKLNPLAQAVYSSVHVMCEWRLGRTEIGQAEDGKKLPRMVESALAAWPGARLLGRRGNRVAVCDMLQSTRALLHAVGVHSDFRHLAGE